MKKVISMISVLIIILMMFTLCACNEKNKLIGTWELAEQFSDDDITDLETITFYSDGTCLVNEEEHGTWSIVDDQLKILGPYGGDFWYSDNIIGEFRLGNGYIGNSRILSFFNPLIDGREYEGEFYYSKVEEDESWWS